MTAEQGTRRAGRHASGGRVSVPPHIAPGARGPRLPGPDLARGVAVLVMLLALLAPLGDLGGFLAGPLFVVLVGLSVGVVLDRPGVSRPRFVVDEVVRGVLLVVLGLVLPSVGAPVDDVLPPLGLLVIVLAPLALGLHRLPVLTLGVAAGAAVLGPLVLERAREARPSGSVARTLLDWLAAGPNHRLVSFLPMALGGLALALLLPRLAGWRPALGVAGVLLASGGVVLALGAASAEGVAASSGTTAQVAASTLLSCGVVVLGVGLAELVGGGAAAARVLSPVFSLGRLSLTAYAMTVLVLALGSLVLGDAGGGAWPTVLVTALVVVAAVWVLDRTWGTGPLELLVRVLRRPTGEHPPSVVARALSAARRRRGPPTPPGSTPPGA
ncbi:hypothetical protein [Phycicoccus avicenniae]|uniref:hypothetical protein n=1 Tax=Phycicoccus avicenniae TaxID=2828860 RepID=UPI003D266749